MACSGSPGGPQDPEGGSLSLFNALDAGESVTLTLDGQSTALPASELKRTLDISAGRHTLKARTATGFIAATRVFDVAAGQRYAVFVARSGATTIVLPILRDTATVPSSTQVKVRLLNLADDSGPMRAWLRINGTPRDAGTEVSADFSTGYGTDANFDGYLVSAPGVHVVTATDVTGETVLAENFKHLAGAHIWLALLVRSPAGALQFRLFRDK